VDEFNDNDSYTGESNFPARATGQGGREQKKDLWFYTHGNTNLVISWNKKLATLEKFSFTCESVTKKVFNNALSRKLKSGTTDLAQAVKLLGIPEDMTIKTVTQEVHYAYQKCVLRLFFRNRTLVDYTLVTNNR
jgi:hypothetical protein